jgi:hypothetical protein
MILDEGVLILTNESLVIKILNELIFDNAVHYFAHCTSKGDWAIIVRITRVAFFENRGNERF